MFQPINLIKIPNSDKPTGDSSRFTIRRRSEQLSAIREKLSIGDIEEQMADELKRKPAEEREEITKAANFTITVPPEEGLALKSDLCLPWRKLRMMRRYSANTLLKFTLLYLLDG